MTLRVIGIIYLYLKVSSFYGFKFFKRLSSKKSSNGKKKKIYELFHDFYFILIIKKLFDVFIRNDFYNIGISYLMMYYPKKKILFSY